MLARGACAQHSRLPPIANGRTDVTTYACIPRLKTTMVPCLNDPSPSSTTRYLTTKKKNNDSDDLSLSFFILYFFKRR